MYSDDELLPISALQHLLYCPRRVALVHIEGLWAENRYTAEGNILHRRAHDPRRGESRPGVRITRGLQLRSYAHGLCGKADVVEFHEAAEDEFSRIVIVEYKRGRPKPERNTEYRVQLCAQALCVEEMLGVTIPEGALYHGDARRRLSVPFDEALRSQTEAAARQLHDLIRSGATPAATRGKRCRNCSMKYLCVPKASRPRATASRYLAELFAGLDSSASMPSESKSD